MANPPKTCLARIISPGLAFLTAAAFLLGCGGIYRQVSPVAIQHEKVDSLITFKESVAAGNYLRGVRRLVPSDRDRMLDDSGRVREDMKPRLRALRLKNLVHDPAVRLRKGRLTGVFAALPVVRQGESVVMDSTFYVEEDSSGTLRVDERDAMLRAATNTFFADIASGNWQFVRNGLHPATRSVFVDKQGRMKPGARKRLQAIDTTAWRALSLRDGKLTGVVLLLPPPESGLEQNSNRFFDALEKKDWESALEILVDREREFLTGPDGKLKGEFSKQLGALDREDWDSLFWYHDRLSGVLELMGVDPVASSL
ncbi:MAG: hypothetical protein M3Y08_07730 [Fibrobacterota bacterium]|nr:hypothetical protein [Fibrobacterota bacterium]